MSATTPLGRVPGYGLGAKILTGADALAAGPALGPLAQLQGTWKGTGWNIISVPGPRPDGFVFEVIPYTETITFSPAVAAGNRGPIASNGEQADQQLTGLIYEQTIISTCNTPLCQKMGFGAGQEIHAETGLFLNVQTFNSGFDVARLSTIPHGNSVLALGKSSTGVAPNNNFPLNPPAPSPLPSLNGRPILDYGLDQFDKQQFPNFNQLNPNSFLSEGLGAKKITAMTTLLLSTSNGKNGGGILNIPFIQQNVDTTFMSSVFWIETIEGQANLQLQYSQTIDLVFPATGTTALVSWPHITVATLEKQP